MVNITHKSTTLRRAIAQATVLVSSPDTIEAIRQKTVPKGDVLEVSRTAGLFAAKRTADAIPDCHPLPVEFTQIKFQINELSVDITAEIHTVYKTGVEVEAMYAASVTALTMYDMLKPIDKAVEIQHIRLIDKQGGKSDVKATESYRAGIIVCSESIFKGEKQDTNGKIAVQKLQALNVEVIDYQIITDNATILQTTIRQMLTQNCNLLLVIGSTGISPKDIAPEAVREILDKEIPGIAEAIRQYGQARTPYAMLSRSVAGLIGETLLLALPGSKNGIAESIDAVFPAIFHIFKVRNYFRSLTDLSDFQD